MNVSNGGSDNIGWVLSARTAERHLLHDDDPDHDPDQHDHDPAEAVLKTSALRPSAAGGKFRVVAGGGLTEHVGSLSHRLRRQSSCEACRLCSRRLDPPGP